MSVEPIGEYERISAKHEAAVARLSPAARHLHFPSKYARPAPLDGVAEELRKQLAKSETRRRELESRVTELTDENARLLTVISETDGAAVSGPPTMARVRLLFLTALAAEHYSVDGRLYRMSDYDATYRRAAFTNPRQVCMWLCRKLTKSSSSQIGQLFGKRDHTTVLWAEKKAPEHMADNPALARAAARVLAHYGKGLDS